ncbi:MAG TPA: HK97-gp10 family putative phage morphogenesis protein [Candidatus Limnocylindrales bacterium]
MADSITFDGSEIRSLARSFDVAGKATQMQVAAVVRKSAFAVERGAKLRAAVDTGNLRNSINTSLLFRGDLVSAEIGPEADYGIYVELGTARMAPQPFLGPAFDEVEPSFLAALADLTGQALA